MFSAVEGFLPLPLFCWHAAAARRFPNVSNRNSLIDLQVDSAMRLTLLTTGLFTVALALPGADNTAAVALLQQKCSLCHGDASGMSGLKVTTRENIIKGGSRGPAVVPNKSGDSLLYKAVAGTGEVLRM